jgi:wyosine [tRNA(Phe)-imidazoG37] synthetase (radical SAM superfamily)
MQIKHIFGPVPSRRLGISLGIDIIPFKTCTFNCLYCECGKTSQLTVRRKSFVDVGVIISELKKTLATIHHIDYLTFSGSGEPTLNKDIGQMIMEIKKFSQIPIAVLTNGSLLFRNDVKRDLENADLILPSLDAASADVFARINQPHKTLNIKEIIGGLVHFRKYFTGKIWLEVFIVRGINDTGDELVKLYQAIKNINPDKVQLNSLDRPPAYENITSVDVDVLENIKKQWTQLPVEVIKRVGKRAEILSFSRNLENSILNTLARRPLLMDDLIQLTGKSRLEILKYIDVLEKEMKIIPKIVGDKIFYMRRK